MDKYLQVGVMAEYLAEVMEAEKVQHQAEQKVDAVVEQLALQKALKSAFLKVYVSVAAKAVDLVEMLACEKEFDWAVTTAADLESMLVLLQDNLLVVQMAVLVVLLWAALTDSVQVAWKDSLLVYFWDFSLV